jgi:hypothetical protein
LPAVNDPEIVCVPVGLQIDYAHVMTIATGSSGYQLKTEWLQPEIDLGIHQTPGMHGEKFHMV